MAIVDNEYSRTFISGTAYADSIENDGNNVKINGGAGNDFISNDGYNVTINGGKGNDSLWGNAGNDTFIYSSGDGNDKIFDYTSDDVIKLAAGTSIKSAKASGSEFVFTIGNQKITVVGGASKRIHVVDANGTSKWYSSPESVKVNGKKVTLTRNFIGNTFDVMNYGGISKTVASAIVTIDASAVDHELSITGNKNSNRIIGTDEDDTISGGKGNDSLWGGAGKDTFIYSSGDGKDIIYGFGKNDLLQITGAFSASYNASKNSIAFKVGTGSVTLKDFGSTTTFHVNSDTYRLSGGKLTKK